MGASVKVYLRADYQKKDGSSPLYLRLTIDRKHKYYTMEISVKKANWNADKQLVKKADPENRAKNTIIASNLNRANEIIFDAQVRRKRVNFHEFEKKFNYKTPGISFYQFIENEIETNLSKKFSKQTISEKRKQLKKLRHFAPKLLISDIDKDFLKAYENYLIHSRGNKPNTVWAALKFLKTSVSMAKEAGVIEENPLAGYKLKSETGNREFLTVEELNTLENYLASPGIGANKRNVLKYFLFCCYTGLRYSDIFNLKHKDIKPYMVDGKETYMIDIVMQKTKKPVKIPLIHKAVELVGNGMGNQKVFKVYTNQPTNRYMKEICKETGIEKNITFHSARHTWATIGIEKGMAIETISNILGHTDIKTTQLYAKHTDRAKVEAMNRWQQIG